MNPAWQARRAGFLASLSARGIRVSTSPTGPYLKVIVQRGGADLGARHVDPLHAVGDRIHALREHLAEFKIGIGDVLKAEDGSSYRITGVEDSPAVPSVAFPCESLSA